VRELRGGEGLRDSVDDEAGEMKESVFEDIIAKYPEVIEDALKLLGRQVNVEGKRIDLLLEDKHGQKLIIELKAGTIVRKDIAQIMDYEGYFVSRYDPTVRVMLVGYRVPRNLQRVFDHHGIEWKEIPPRRLESFLNEKGDKDLLRFVSEEVAENDTAEYGSEKEGTASPKSGSTKTRTTAQSAKDTRQRRVDFSRKEGKIVQTAYLMRSGYDAAQIAAKLNIPLNKIKLYVGFLKNNRHPSVVEFFRGSADSGR